MPKETTVAESSNWASNLGPHDYQADALAACYFINFEEPFSGLKELSFNPVNYSAKTNYAIISARSKYSNSAFTLIQQSVKIQLKRYFFEDNNCASGFMVDLAVGYYHEHAAMVGG